MLVKRSYDLNVCITSRWLSWIATRSGVFLVMCWHCHQQVWPGYEKKTEKEWPSHTEWKSWFISDVSKVRIWKCSNNVERTYVWMNSERPEVRIEQCSQYESISSCCPSCINFSSRSEEHIVIRLSNSHRSQWSWNTCCTTERSQRLVS